MPLGPSARRWVRFFQSGLDLSHNSALAQELVERVEAVHTLDDTVLTARAAFTPRGQGPVAVGGHSALLGPQQIWCGTCSPLNDKVRFLSGQIDFSVPCAYLPSDPGSSAFNFMWSRVAMDDTSRHLDWATIERIINTTSWGGGATLGDYPGWSGASGRNRIFLEWVLQIIYSYRSFMPREWPSQAVMRAYTGQSAGSALGMSAAPLLGGVHSAYNPSASSPLLVAGAGGGVSGRHYCRDAESAVGDLMENEAAFLVVWAPGADLCPLDGADQLQEHVDATTCERSYDLWEGLPYGMTVPYRGQNGSAGVQVCSSWIAGPARTADHFLHWGNRAYWTAISGQSEDLKDCLELLNASRLCGRVALGATMIPARTLMHEFIHRALSGDHCSTACCPQGLAVIFWAATRAYLGVPSVIVGTPGQVDTDFLDDSDFYSSQCHQANNESFAITFTWDDVGSSGKSNAYSISNVTWAPSCLP